MPAQCDTKSRPFALLRASILRPLTLRFLVKKPCLRFLFRCEGWYSWPLVLCRTCSRGEKTEEATLGVGLKRERRLGRARSREDVGNVEGRMGLRGTRDDANELEDVARGTTAAGRTGGRESSRASEGGIRGIVS